MVTNSNKFLQIASYMLYIGIFCKFLPKSAP